MHESGGVFGGYVGVVTPPFGYILPVRVSKSFLFHFALKAGWDIIIFIYQHPLRFTGQATTRMKLTDVCSRRKLSNMEQFCSLEEKTRYTESFQRKCE